MTKTLNNIYNSGILDTPNIQLVNKTFADETIKFVDDLKKRNSFQSACFINVRLNNIKFIEISFLYNYILINP